MKIGSLEGFVDKTWQVVHDSGELAAAVTSYTISGLNGDVDCKYRLISRVVNGYNGATQGYIQLNNDTTNNHYGYQLLEGTNTSAVAARGTPGGFPYLYNAALNQICVSDTIMYLKSGFVRTAICQYTHSISGTTVAASGIFGGSFNNTADEITSMIIAFDQANGIGIGSRFILLKEVRIASGLRTGELDIRGTLKGAWQEVYRHTVTGVYGSDIAPSYSALTASAVETGAPVANIVDGNPATCWSNYNAGTTGWVKFQFASAKTVKKYSLVGAADAGLTNGMPKNWTLQGSNDNSNWTTIDTQTNQTSWTSALSRTYITSNTTAYLYYKLDITAINGRNHIILAEMKMYELLSGEGEQTSITVSGLKGNTLDQILRVRVRAVGGHDGAAGYVIRFNNDSGSNYGQQYLQGASTVLAAGRISPADGIMVQDDPQALGHLAYVENLFYLKSGYLRTGIHERTCQISGTTVGLMTIVGDVWANTSDEVTSLVFAGQPNTFGVGSELVIERLNL